MSSAVTLDEAVIADDPSNWEKLGFNVDGDRCQVGRIVLRFVEQAEHPGFQAITVRGLSNAQCDGLAIQPSTAPQRELAPRHPNGVIALDHVVAFSWRFEQTVMALQAAGFDLRRIREEPTPAGAPRQAFFHLGDAILELVDPLRGDEELPRLWGLAFVAKDLARLSVEFGDLVSNPRPAVQPGREIATLKKTAGLALPVAFMAPRESSK